VNIHVSFLKMSEELTLSRLLLKNDSNKTFVIILNLFSHVSCRQRSGCRKVTLDYTLEMQENRQGRSENMLAKLESKLGKLGYMPEKWENKPVMLGSTQAMLENKQEKSENRRGMLGSKLEK
jgi:hypothetical protein